MLIADFHNDILTSKNFSKLPESYSQNKIVTAVYNDGRPFADALRLAEVGELIAFEDLGYKDVDVDAVISKRPKYVGITWNGENKFGYGCNFTEGLKGEGISLIRALNKAGIAVDTAHISKGGFKDVIDNAEKVVNSHTCFNGVYRHKRNLDDWQLDLLVRRGAMVGVTFCGYFMTDRKTCEISDLTAEIDYFAQRYGINNLCLGTDYYGSDFFPSGLNDYNDFYLLEESLIRLGYKREDVEKIFYGNLNEFLENDR